MRQITLLTTVILLFSCGGSKMLKVDRTNPVDTATAVLVAYKGKNLNVLKQLSTQENIRIIDQMLLDPNLAEGRRVFNGWRWDMINKWDGTIKEIRTLTDETVYAAFYEPSNALPSTEIGVVALELEGGQWVFSDIHSPTKASFAKLKKLEF